MCYIFGLSSLFLIIYISLISELHGSLKRFHKLSWLFYNCRWVDPPPLLVYPSYIWPNRFHSPFCLNGVAVDNDITPCSRVHLHSLGASAATEHLLAAAAAADRLDRRSTRSLYAKLAALWPLQLLPRLLTPQTCRTIAEVRGALRKRLSPRLSTGASGERKKNTNHAAARGSRSARPLFCCLGAAVLKNAWIWIMSIFPTNEPGQ